MVESEKGEDDVPDKKKTEEKRKVLNLDSHGQKLIERDRFNTVEDCPSGQDKGAGHNQQIRQLEGFEENLTSKWGHGFRVIGCIGLINFCSTFDSIEKFQTSTY